MGASVGVKVKTASHGTKNKRTVEVIIKISETRRKGPMTHRAGSFGKLYLR